MTHSPFRCAFAGNVRSPSCSSTMRYVSVPISGRAPSSSRGSRPIAATSPFPSRAARVVCPAVGVRPERSSVMPMWQITSTAADTAHATRSGRLSQIRVQTVARGRAGECFPRAPQCLLLQPARRLGGSETGEQPLDRPWVPRSSRPLHEAAEPSIPRRYLLAAGERRHARDRTDDGERAVGEVPQVDRVALRRGKLRPAGFEARAASIARTPSLSRRRRGCGTRPEAPPSGVSCAWPHRSRRGAPSRAATISDPRPWPRRRCRWARRRNTSWTTSLASSTDPVRQRARPKICPRLRLVERFERPRVAGRQPREKFLPGVHSRAPEHAH